MGGEGKSVSFRRTENTTKTNKQLLKEFQKIIYSSRVVMHMKWYGKDRSVDILEHGDSNRQEWEQKYVPIEGTFQFEISVYDSWYKDADLYESHDREDSFVSLARKFANDNALMYFPCGFTPEWYSKNEEGKYEHFKVEPDDKNIDKICKLWHLYGMNIVKAEQYGQTDDMKSYYWKSATDQIKELITI